MARVALTRSAAVNVPLVRALREVTITGVGVSVIPRYIVQDALREGQLFELYEPMHRKFNTLFIAHRDEPSSDLRNMVIHALEGSAASWEERAGVAV